VAEPIVELLGVSRRYGSELGRVDALIDVDLQVSDGDWLAIVDPSGSASRPAEHRRLLDVQPAASTCSAASTWPP
jgi:ABC-type microcin C transport system duplicated ATPase subunit YejF